MNYIAKIVEVLGLEWDAKIQESEKFQVAERIGNTYKFTMEGLFFKYKWNGVDTEYEISDCLNEVIVGTFKIIKKPWQPKISDEYFYISLAMPEYYDTDIWSNHPVDNRILEAGIVFRTKQEALAKAKRIVEFIKKDGEQQ